MTTYTVSFVRRDSNQPTRSCDFDTLAEAIEYAASLARVQPRAIRRRIREWSHPSDCYQVGGREIGGAGVWIEY